MVATGKKTLQGMVGNNGKDGQVERQKKNVKSLIVYGLMVGLENKG